MVLWLVVAPTQAVSKSRKVLALPCHCGNWHLPITIIHPDEARNALHADHTLCHAFLVVGRPHSYLVRQFSAPVVVNLTSCSHTRPIKMCFI